jgi:hypothetical protein
VKAVVTGRELNDPVRFRQLVAQRNAAFTNFLQAFIRRSRDRAARADGHGDGDA